MSRVPRRVVFAIIDEFRGFRRVPSTIAKTTRLGTRLIT
jgi:hypothetical protein